jgi:hypothetical protein
MKRIALAAALLWSAAASASQADVADFLVANRTDVTISSLRVANAGLANWSDEQLTGVAIAPGRNAMLTLDAEHLYDVALGTPTGTCVVQNVELNDADPTWELTTEVLSACTDA